METKRHVEVGGMPDMEENLVALLDLPPGKLDETQISFLEVKLKELEEDGEDDEIIEKIKNKLAENLKFN